MKEGIFDVMYASDDQVIGGRSRNGQPIGKPFNGVGDADGLCVLHETFKASVTFHRWPYIPSGGCVWGPCVTSVGLVVDQHVNTGGRKWSGVVVETPK